MSRTDSPNTPYWTPDEPDPDRNDGGEDRDPRAKRRERAAAVLARRVRRRAWMRDLARALLVGALVTLGVLAVEIGRKAFVVLHRADLATTAPADAG